MPRAVLFDLDDTLFDHRHGTHQALAALQVRYPCFRGWTHEAFAARHSQLLERLHLDVLAGMLSVDEARIRRFGDLLAEAGEPEAAELAAEAAAAYRAAYLAAWRLVPGSNALLAALRSRGLGIGVVTNNVVSEQTRKIDALGLRPFLDSVVISEAAGVTKPDPRIFFLALAELSAEPAEAVMVGDSWTADVVGARAAGLRAVWFNPEGRERPAAGEVPELASFEPTADAVATILRG